MKHSEFLSRHDDEKIVSAIAAAEGQSSGEIRVFISRKIPRNGAETLALAQETFTRLGMRQTRHRNGMLLFFAPSTQQFAIVGDAGVHEKCGDSFWQEVAEGLSTLLKQGHFTAAVLAGIDKAGKVLAEHFPRDRDDRNELPNRVETD